MATTTAPPPQATPKSHNQNRVLRQLVRDKKQVFVTPVAGDSDLYGVITDYDSFTFTLEYGSAPGRTALIFKSNVIAIHFATPEDAATAAKEK